MKLFYEQGLYLITDMLNLHTPIKALRIENNFIAETSSQPPNWIEIAQRFWQTISRHPSLQYILITKFSLVLEHPLIPQEKTPLTKEQPPLVEWVLSC